MSDRTYRSYRSYRSLSPGLLRRLQYDNENRHTSRARRNAITERDDRIFSRFYLEPEEEGLINRNLFMKSYIKMSFTDDDFCVICQNDISKMTMVRVLHCTHVFHLGCIDKHFIRKTHCPTCRYDMLN